MSKLPKATEPDMIRLWTVQNSAGWEEATRRGVLRADGRRVWRSFRDPYAWMRKQMNLRLSPSRRYPIWAWCAPPGYLSELEEESGVVVEYLMPRTQVLCSLFEEWHAALNHWYLPKDECDAAKFEARFPDTTWDTGSTEWRAEVKRSWESVFDLNSSECTHPVIQATMWEVPLTAVLGVTAFVGNGGIPNGATPSTHATREAEDEDEAAA